MDEQSNKLFCVILHFISAKLHLDPTNRNITKPFYKQQFSTATAGFFQLKHIGSSLIYNFGSIY